MGYNANLSQMSSSFLRSESRISGTSRSVSVVNGSKAVRVSMKCKPLPDYFVQELGSAEYLIHDRLDVMGDVGTDVEV